MELPLCSFKMIKQWQFHNLIKLNVLLIYFRASEGAGVNFIASSIGKIVYMREREKQYICVCVYVSVCVYWESVVWALSHASDIQQRAR